jgi:Zn-finger nucleic acid-binding protein
MRIQRIESELIAFQEAPAVGPATICPGCAERSLKPAKMRAVAVARCAPCAGVFLTVDAAELIAARVIVAAQEWTEGRQLTGNMKLDDILRNPNRSMGG